MRERRRIFVEGIVQGVGFRPFVYGLASRYALAGFVLNHSAGVHIEVEGEPGGLTAFLQALRGEAPPLASIEGITCQIRPPTGETSFSIVESHIDVQRVSCISPDIGMCNDCLHELFDPSNRRFRYPFINCTNCGPRFTITLDVPYDRERTTMAAFRMCPDCLREYNDPADRRFHAQPNACPACGPRVRLLQRDGGEVSSSDPILIAAECLRRGAIVAVKGLGGYHLACNAFDAQAVASLRRRKRRPDKPFALMGVDLAAVRRLCGVDTAEEALLTSARRPIVLLKQREPHPLPQEVAPGQRFLGVMLPYTPLHHLLLREAGPVLVMTSGNLSEEPMAYRDEEALQRLAAIADYFLVHDREIHRPCEDAVTRILNGHERRIRRSRGDVPQPIALPIPFLEPVLACGAQLKNTFCLGKRRHAYVSHHIGDLDHYETFAAFVEGIEHLQRLLEIRPTVVAYDLHPEYLSTRYALRLEGVARIGVQHHHAHIASGMAEHGLNGTVIGVAFDGSGYGSDGTIWGGEILLADYVGFTRLAHLEYVPLPGGEQAIRQPWRMAAAYLYQVYGQEMETLDLDWIRRLDRRRWKVLKQMLRQGLNCPLTSSIGRLFDAVASLVGVRHVTTYEGQAAIELEMIADEECRESYAYAIDEGSRPMVLRAGGIIRGVVEDLLREISPARISARFHETLVQVLSAICRKIHTQTGVDRVVLSGGVFQNALLLRRVEPALAALGLQVYIPHRVPPNDGGISLGQVAIANARMLAGMIEG